MFVLIINAFLMVIPNIVTKFHNFDIFENCVKFGTVVCSPRLPRGISVKFLWGFENLAWKFNGNK